MIPREWVHSAACRDGDVSPELFHSSNAVQQRMAKLICQGCPVTDNCLQDALRRNDPWGVWGGLDSRERDRLVRGRR